MIIQLKKLRSMENVKCKGEYVYGDTDSVFFTFNLKELDETPIIDKKALEITIELAQQAGALATKIFKETTRSGV